MYFAERTALLFSDGLARSPSLVRPPYSGPPAPDVLTTLSTKEKRRGAATEAQLESEQCAALHGLITAVATAPLSGCGQAAAAHAILSSRTIRDEHPYQHWRRRVYKHAAAVG